MPSEPGPNESGTRDLGALAADILSLAASEDDLDALLCQIVARVRDLQLGVTGRVAHLERLARELAARNDTDRSVPPALFETLGELLDDLSRASDIVPMCAVCKRVREPAQAWHAVEEFIADRSRVRLSHTYCPECYRRAVRDLERPKA